MHLPRCCELHDAVRESVGGRRRGAQEVVGGPSERVVAAAGWEAVGAAGGGRMGGGRRSRFLRWTPPELTLEEQPERILSLPRNAMTGALPFRQLGDGRTPAVWCSLAGRTREKNQVYSALTVPGKKSR